jgi:enoyl-[acyl-carrier-protein] reductase (NADH)
VTDVFAVEKEVDIANMVAYLASPAGECITGAIMIVDGGASLARNPAPSALVLPNGWS